MKAIQYRSYGDYSENRLVDLPQPALRDGEVLVAMRTVAINPLDNTFRSGHFYGATPENLPRIGGQTGAGAVFDRTQALAQLQQMQSDFAHTNRVSMMGEFAASLSHEITQSIASARNNARAALNFLDQQPPDLGEVKEALGCVVADADRAGDIVGRIRDHIKKAPPPSSRPAAVCHRAWR
jgi:C4-dicarboxylate-specific signal transduction histidine kinase